MNTTSAYCNEAMLSETRSAKIIFLISYDYWLNSLSLCGAGLTVNKLMIYIIYSQSPAPASQSTSLFITAWLQTSHAAWLQCTFCIHCHSSTSSYSHWSITSSLATISSNIHQVLFIIKSLLINSIHLSIPLIHYSSLLAWLQHVKSAVLLVDIQLFLMV